MSTKYAALLMSLIAVGPLSAFAQSITYSGTALNAPPVSYASAYSGDAQYVAGTPDVAQLYTADLSTADTADSPAVFIKLSPGITLDSLYASYVTASGTTVDPYWTLFMTDDPTFAEINDPIVSTDSGPLGSSSLVHVGDLISGSITLSALDADIDPVSGLPYGGETVAYVGLEIGDGGSGAGTANIESITIGSSVPDGASTVLLLGFGLAGLGVMSLRKNRLSAAK
jgi:hypothetical protein